MTMLMIIAYIFLIFCFPSVQLVHFQGGTVSWKFINYTNTSSRVDVMFTQSYQWTLASTPCNQATISNQSPLLQSTGGILNCVTGSSSCGGYTSLSVGEYCTDFSTLLGSSSGQISTIKSIAAGSQFCVAFQSGNWIGIQVSGIFTTSALWSIGTCVNLTVRPNGMINTPPVVTIISPIRVAINSSIRITIPTIDADNDFTRCRWANKTSTFDECGGVCQRVPSTSLDNNGCVLTFNSTGTKVGEYYAIALMIEDFATPSTSIPFSSVPLQFLITIMSPPICPLKPKISSTLSPCTAIEVGVQFNYTLTISQGCVGANVIDVFTMPPLYMYKGSITQVGTTNVWTLTETWIPKVSQLGSQVYCAIATDNAGIQSDQYCLTFTVVPAGQTSLCPGVTTSTTSTSTTTSTSDITTTATTTTGSTLTSTSFGTLLTLCCCCGWCLFCYRLGRRRHRQKAKKSQAKHLLRSDLSSLGLTLPTSSLSNEQKFVPTRGRHFDKHHKSHKDAMIHPLKTRSSVIINSLVRNISKLKDSSSSGSSTDSYKNENSEFNEPLSTKINSLDVEPFSNADKIYKIDCFRLPNTETVSVSTIQLPRATLPAPIGQETQSSKLYCPTSQTLLSNDGTLLKLKQNNSITITKQLRSVARNHKDTSRISHKFLSSAKTSNNLAVRIIKINSLNLPSIVSNGSTMKTDI
ncbi:unnamed protein product [Adineta ricciae]|uniref:Uncharacterized protein n=1 Tax=Adineta ricciae TaxID=249248 RepID=A0A815V8E1_ADIRI|nr:unnamed protein product [Adineta ricciae]